MIIIFYYIIGIIIIAIISIVISGTHSVKIEHIEIQKKVPSNFRFIHISDIHNKAKFINGRISSIINSTNPDFVVITGDYSNTQKKLPKVIKELGTIKQPVLMVLGNYEREEQKNLFMKRNISLDKLSNEISKYDNLKLLINESLILTIGETKILIYGFDNSVYGNEKYDIGIEKISNDYKIILAHSPNIINTIESKEISYNHILVGHTHGRQINIPTLYKTAYDRFHIGCKKIKNNQYFP
ncbi:metallophosphoesterase [Tissierella sp. MB52-C2]|uniref:metallophosphoesterase n=1 Tax=Tissierella sp. MB52-C2 TaxID=3070999 RepID=UPI00280B729B|nr:metallophosphoesterase [Tissierella sp. MB52-C2]WMM23935.1 metallophosphoesterase [Tissierella sp. MB52-C2]